MTLINQPTSYVNRNISQVSPIILVKPIQYPTPYNLRFTQPSNFTHPRLSSNNNLQIIRPPPIVRRFFRPSIVRPLPPRLVPRETTFNRLDSTNDETDKIPTRISSVASSLSIPSTIHSNHEEIENRRKPFYSCFPCCKQKTIKSPKFNNHHSYNGFNCKLNTRIIYIIVILLFIFFLIVIILLIVLIVVRS